MCRAFVSFVSNLENPTPMRKKSLYKQFLTWHSNNLGKMVLLSFLLSLMIFVSFATPYVNTVFTISTVITFFLCIWQILFHPSITTNVVISFVILCLIGMLTAFRFYAFAEYLGNLVFFFLLFLCINIIYTWLKES